MCHLQSPFVRGLLGALIGAFIAGALDIGYAIAVWGLRGAEPAAVLKGIASGLYGRAAYDGGAAMATLGLSLHFFILFCAALVYFAATRWLPVFIRHAVLGGLAFGLGMFLVMNYVVVPLSAAPFGPPAGWMYFGAICAHLFLVGLPIALAARRAA